MKKIPKNKKLSRAIEDAEQSRRSIAVLLPGGRSQSYVDHRMSRRRAWSVDDTVYIMDVLDLPLDMTVREYLEYFGRNMPNET